MRISAPHVRIFLALLAAFALLQARIALAECAITAPQSAMTAECCEPFAAPMSDARDIGAQLCGNYCLRPSARSEDGSSAFIQSQETPLPGPSAIGTEWAGTGPPRLEPFAEPRADGRNLIYELQRLLI